MFGAGATGSVFAARLTTAGHSVTVVARAAHVAEIRAHGLTIEGIRPGRFAVSAAERIAGLPVPEALLLTVKTFDLDSSMGEIAEGFSPLPPTLLPQNGLGIDERVRGRLPEPARRSAPLVRAIASVPATWLAPGRVRQAGEGELLVGAHSGNAPHPWASTFRELFRGSGIPVREVADLPREEWRKALVNAAINPVTADHGVLNGRLADDPWRGQALALLHEARHSAALDGFEFGEAEAEADLFRVVHATAENRSSMLQDLERGRATEIDAISGTILERAWSHHVDLPATRRAVDRINEHVRRRDRLRAPQSS